MWAEVGPRRLPTERGLDQREARRTKDVTWPEVGLLSSVCNCSHNVRWLMLTKRPKCSCLADQKQSHSLKNTQAFTIKIPMSKGHLPE